MKILISVTLKHILFIFKPTKILYVYSVFVMCMRWCDVRMIRFVAVFWTLND